MVAVGHRSVECYLLVMSCFLAYGTGRARFHNVLLRRAALSCNNAANTVNTTYTINADAANSHLDIFDSGTLDITHTPPTPRSNTSSNDDSRNSNAARTINADAADRHVCQQHRRLHPFPAPPYATTSANASAPARPSRRHSPTAQTHARIQALVHRARLQSGRVAHPGTSRSSPPHLAPGLQASGAFAEDQDEAGGVTTAEGGALAPIRRRWRHSVVIRGRRPQTQMRPTPARKSAAPSHPTGCPGGSPSRTSWPHDDIDAFPPFLSITHARSAQLRKNSVKRAASTPTRVTRRWPTSQPT